MAWRGTLALFKYLQFVYTQLYPVRDHKRKFRGIFTLEILIDNQFPFVDIGDWLISIERETTTVWQNLRTRIQAKQLTGMVHIYVPWFCNIHKATMETEISSLSSQKEINEKKDKKMTFTIISKAIISTACHNYQKLSIYKNYKKYISADIYLSHVWTIAMKNFVIEAERPFPTGWEIACTNSYKFSCNFLAKCEGADS